jgi:hypothetical protein
MLAAITARQRAEKLGRIVGKVSPKDET